MQPVIRIDADEMGVDRRVMDFGERNTIRNDWLAEPLILVCVLLLPTNWDIILCMCLVMYMWIGISSLGHQYLLRRLI
jgi:hypothetical protein